ncbi:MAG TPA: Rne/Rng family ribonuclease, partial [Alphaproteobacteria bacterium]|nr:Rne/Rng family ribonuclease [Alphaproteobacteria bacterium]
GRSRGRGGRDNGRGRGGRGRNAAHRARRVETFGGEDMDDEQRFRFNLRRKYKIQEVIKRGQIMLVQVSKEERGNKGAAVGSYLSLPGRYCVLMPNSPRAGGVSRKISNYKDRAKMRDMMKDLEVPKGMSVILRTAGVTRTKVEVKRDLDYLLRLWNTIREKTLESSAPALVYEEADLIKRAVRDLYTRDIEEIHVAGDEGFKTAKEFMKMMIPSHVKKVKEYKDVDTPLFNKFRVEEQIAEIGETEVRLKSGGYLVINPTEALVSIDVNSGKATKERHIEETALKTNLEAADEVARQLRLRDLGGLVVIDFIDMEDRRNNGKVERKMRDALSGDRARIQMGRISSFGLMELSRQRLSASLSESQFETCPGCQGAGRIRTADAASIMVLRAIEAEGIKGRASQVIVQVSNEVALYILNNKRDNLAVIEERYGFAVLIRVDDTLGASGFRVEVSKPVDKTEDDSDDTPAGEDDQDGNNRRDGRRRGRRGGRNRGMRNQPRKDDNAGEEQADQKSQNAVVQADSKVDEKAPQEKKKPSASAEKATVDAASKKVRVKKEESTGKDDKKPSASAKTMADGATKKAPVKKAKKNDEPVEPKDEKPAKVVKVSNDDAKPKKVAVKARKDDAPKDYETVNEAPKAKKKGWWNLK